jgi:hypothetical protein
MKLTEKYNQNFDVSNVTDPCREVINREFKIYDAADSTMQSEI